MARSSVDRILPCHANLATIEISVDVDLIEVGWRFNAIWKNVVVEPSVINLAVYAGLLI
jgi:hypothetical protein